MRTRTWLTRVLAVATTITSTTVAATLGGPSDVSADVRGDVLLTGRVLDVSGAGAGSARVTVFVDAGEDELARLRLGDSYELIPVSTAVSDGHGTFTARLDADVALGAHAGGDGFVDFLAIAATDGQQALLAFSRAIAPDGSVAPVGAASPEAAADALDGPGVAAASVAAPPGGGGDPDEPVLRMRPRTGPDAQDPSDIVAAGPPPAGSCSYRSSAGNRWVHVGATYHRHKGAAADFRFGRGASATMGIAWSYSGRYGSWEAGGTNTRSTSAAVDFPGTRGRQDRFYYTAWEYGWYHCVLHGSRGGYTFWVVKPTNWRLGTEWAVPAYTPRTPLSNCTATFRAGSRMEQSTTRATTWTAGVRIGTLIGINLSSQSGFTQEARIVIVFKRDGMLACGVAGRAGNNSGEAPGRIVIRRAP